MSYINSNNINLAGDILEHSYKNFIDMNDKVNSLYKVNVGYTQKTTKRYHLKYRVHFMFR